MAFSVQFRRFADSLEAAAIRARMSEKKSSMLAMPTWCKPQE